MRKWFILIIVQCSILTMLSINTHAQISISTDNSAPDVSAMLDVKSTSKGFLPPRVALTAINSPLPVATPMAGLLVYNTATAGTVPNNVLPGYYGWNGIKWLPVLAPQGTSVGDMQYWNGTQWVSIPAGSNGQVLTFINGVPTWGGSTTLCGVWFTVNHVAGAVSPVSKTVSYGTVTNIPGEPSKCWITSNLGADHQATAVNDATEASAGWYWQVNHKQGFKNDGSGRTPNSPWLCPINENSDWVAANDPCSIELGGSWRVPTSAEWTNVNASGNWTDWNGPWNSGLKLHAAGYLYANDGLLRNRGTGGGQWSSTQVGLTSCWVLYFDINQSNMGNDAKAHAYSIRCVRDF